MLTREYEAIHQKFIQKQKDLRAGPKQFRKCKDICCLITFLLLLAAFLAIGIYYLVVSNQVLRENKVPIISTPLTVVKELFIKYWPLLIGMFGLSFLLSIVFVCLLRNCTKCMVYSVIVCAIIALCGIMGISIVSQAWGTLIAAGITLIFLLIFLFCYRTALQQGIIFLRAAMSFLKSRIITYAIPFWILLLFILFLAFWIISFVCMQYQASLNTNDGFANAKQIVFQIFYIFMLIFMAIFLYYAMVFLIGYVCAKWYYDHRNIGCCRGDYLLNRAHIGSLTFATLIIVFIKILQWIGSTVYKQQSAVGNSCGACCACCVSCCLGAAQVMIQVLNKNAVITMSLTGQSFFESAKTAASIIYRYFPLFYAITAIGQILKYAGIIFAAGIPTLIGYLILHTVYNQKIANSYQVTIFIILVFFICLVISLYFIHLISTCLNAVFIFFCLDRRFRQMGVTLANTPLTFKRLNERPQFQFNQPQPLVPYSAERLR